jgi:hypothetical protein
MNDGKEGWQAAAVTKERRRQSGLPAAWKMPLHSFSCFWGTGSSTLNKGITEYFGLRPQGILLCGFLLLRTLRLFQ